MDESLVRGHWKYIALFNLIPCVIALYCNYFELDETARYTFLFVKKKHTRNLVVNNKYDEGIEIINKMGMKNNPEFNLISENEKQILMHWRKLVFNYIEYPQVNRFINLYNSNNLPVTLRLKFLNILLNFVQTGMTFLMPLMIRRQLENDFFLLYKITLSDVPAIIIVFLLVDVKQVGRLRLIYPRAHYNTRLI